ncbi:type II toxin-antitoxin system VapC family toxin [Ramlibacter sp.]|uniref:type II toxin-antitoxin system VapC family toxin n=1 Tax=Ramlibacter sp. TaxID=1917967 RepID=UPI003D0993F1
MRVLLDTHIFLWAVAGSRKLPVAARRLMDSADEVHVSAASIWEIAIKANLGKLKVDPLQLAESIEASGFLELPITAVHAAAVSRLGQLHGDPFDRLLIAQATMEPLRLITADEQLPQYSDLVVLV